MAERQPVGDGRQITPKYVFGRSNMPSRWERLTGVAPKIAEDRALLAFTAARYRGEKRLPHPGALVVPAEVHLKQRADLACGWTCVAAVVFGILGLVAGQSVVVVLAAVALTGAVAVVIGVAMTTESAIVEFRRLRSQCEAAHARINADSLDPQYRSTLNEMINCDEGTLAYCAAKIASEIQRDTGWRSAGFDVAGIDLWDELAEIGMSARQIAEDREMTETLQRGRLRDDPEIRDTIEADNRLRDEAIALLAARVSALADYRDRVHRRGAVAARDDRLTSRAMRLAVDELAAKKLR